MTILSRTKLRLTGTWDSVIGNVKANEQKAIEIAADTISGKVDSAIRKKQRGQTSFEVTRKTPLVTSMLPGIMFYDSVNVTSPETVALISEHFEPIAQRAKDSGISLEFTPQNSRDLGVHGNVPPTMECNIKFG